MGFRLMDDFTRYIHENIGREFEWGRFDCMSFANEALRIHTGEAGPFDFFYREYRYDTVEGAARAHAKWTRDNGEIVDYADTLWSRMIVVNPTHGLLVARRTSDLAPMGLSFGVVVVGMCAFVTQEFGLALHVPHVHDLYWDVAP